jgi:hypothetical protein
MTLVINYTKGVDFHHNIIHGGRSFKVIQTGYAVLHEDNRLEVWGFVWEIPSNKDIYLTDIIRNAVIWRHEELEIDNWEKYEKHKTQI